MKVIRKIRKDLQHEIDIVIKELLTNCKTKYDTSNIRGYIADCKRGYAWYSGDFTVPLWAFDRRHKGKNYRGDDGYFMYYVAHELAHQLRYKTNTDGSHDFLYYKVFMDICPKELQHFELNYKPSASKYGINAK